jgi:hypothetical protein
MQSSGKAAEEDLYYGSRKSDKYVRCYPKKNLGFRVELELHSGLLRQHSISALADLRRLPEVIYPKHLHLVAPDWKKLEKYLSRKFGGDSHRILIRAQRRSVSLHRMQRYLKRKGVPNFHRFLVPLALNRHIASALMKWASHFGEIKKR